MFFGNDRIKPLSKQSVLICRLLIDENKLLSARRIAMLTGISQQNVYRLVRPLVEKGLVVSGPIINIAYRARPKSQARNAYVKSAEAEFERLFGDAYDAQV